MGGYASIGLDIGSSLTKVCFRVVDVGNTAIDGRQVVSVAHAPAEACNGQTITERPTCLWTDGAALSLHMRSGWEPVRDLKQRLMDAWDQAAAAAFVKGDVRVPLRALMTIHVIKVLSETRTAIAQYVKYRGLRSPQQWFVNCAIPSERILINESDMALKSPACPRRCGLADLVERARRAVFEQGVVIGDVVSPSYAQRLCDELDAYQLDDGGSGTTCLPEAMASILAAIDHPSFAERSAHWDLSNPRRSQAVPTVLVMDCGSLTTEFALFSYRRDHDVEFYAAGSCMAGAGLLSSDEVAGLEAFQREAQRFYRHFWKLIFGRTLGEGNPDVILPGLNRPQWRVLMLGGGVRISGLADALLHLSLPSGHLDSYRIAPMASAQTMSLPDQAIGYVVVPSGNGMAPVVVDLRRGRVHTRQLDQVRESLRQREFLHQLAIGLSTPVLDMPGWTNETIRALSGRQENPKPADWENPHHHT